MSTVYFHDLNKSVDIPEGADENVINDIHDSVMKDISNGTQKPDNSQNILHRAASNLTQPFTDMHDPMQMANILNPALGAYQGMHSFKTDLIKDNVKNPVTAGLTDFATNPETIITAGGALKGIKNIGSSILNPSKAYGKVLGSQTGTVDNYKIIMEALDDPVAGKYLDKADILSKYGGQTLGEGGSISENLSNLSPKESQNLINDLKDVLTQKQREGILKASQLKLGNLINNLVDAHNEAFPGMKTARFMYGLSKDIGKAGQLAVKGALFGAPAGAAAKFGGSVAGSLYDKIFSRR